jgi:hypothetical protein
MDSVLGNGSVNRPEAYEYATTQGRPLPGNGAVNPLDIVGNGVFYEFARRLITRVCLQ